MSAAPKQLGKQLTEEEFSFQAALGGPRGFAEATAPGLGFLVVFLISSSLLWSLVVALGIGAVLAVVRLIDRTALTQVTAGFAGVAISALWAWKSGRGSDFFALGLVTNLVLAVIFLLLLIVRQDPIGLILAGTENLPRGWRTRPEYHKLNRACVRSTWLWVALCAARLLVQAPLWWAGSVVWLGTARLLMGLPLFALVAWLMWMMVSSALTEVKMRATAQ
ncbi:DUF3159 domain-containing protein [Boudabousia marimammalium]|uniref:DUF3159 domain-containing protein n=1 Tax=Boudabousia marimammalium TaxID=156892 RepID=A0A1Q5PQQ5_9ACTO|nr:DUF3159 domain-containing protein [Boudabousia marimammalium]OKL49951.1 hypothetical protein BM477_03335 [Boudabousia marimammalium]